MELLPSDLLDIYIKTFYGYGNWKSNFWFIGIEEGGGNDFHNVKKRLESWQRHKSDLIDIQEHHEFLGLSEFFTKGKLQNTWRKLILTKLAFEGRVTEKNLVIDTQKTNWGHLNSSNLLIELFPLASPNNNCWCYEKWTELAYVKNGRDTYYNTVSPFRIKYIQEKIEKHKPEVVLFYGKKMQHYWDEIIKNDDSGKINIANPNAPEKERQVKFFRTGDSYFFQVAHPASVYSNWFWIELGKHIRFLTTHSS